MIKFGHTRRRISAIENFAGEAEHLKTVKLPEKFSALLRTPPLTRRRMVLGLAIAAGADGLQLLLGPLGWAFADQAIDLAAMILLSGVIGFHVLFLPTFVVELVPVLEDLPTWTACAAAVIALRKREQRTAKPPTSPDQPVIDI